MKLNQGDIVKVNFNPQKGHEQAGYRPALIVSNNIFMAKTKLSIVCPITNTDNNFPLHIKLDSRTKTTGVVMCEQVRTLDLNARDYMYIESIPSDLLENILNVVIAEIQSLDSI